MSSFFLLVDTATFGALRLPFHRVETCALHWLFTLPADEAVGVPLSVEGRDVVLHDGTSAARTLGREQLEVVVLAVGLAILLVEPVLPELVAAVRAEEVLRVPGLVEGSNAFL